MIPRRRVDFPYIDDFCDDEAYVFSTIGQGPKGEKGDRGDDGTATFPTFADPIEWDRGSSYDANVLVYHDGRSYISKRDVPSLIDITDTQFWAIASDVNAQTEELRQEVEQLSDAIGDISDIIPFRDFNDENTVKSYVDENFASLVNDAVQIVQGGTGATTASSARNSLGVPTTSSIANTESVIATMNHAVGDYFMLGDVLMRATAAIAAGETINASKATPATVQSQIDTLRDSVAPKTVAITKSEKIDNFVCFPKLIGKIVVVSYYFVPSTNLVRNDVIATIDVPSDFDGNYFNGSVNLKTQTKNLTADTSFSSNTGYFGQIVGLIC